MSSTNRGGKRSPSDNYPTPPYCVRRLLEDDHAAAQLPGGNWLEPGAGEGSIIRTVNECRDDVTWTALELRPETKTDLIHAVGSRGTVLIENYLEPDLHKPSGIRAGYAVAMGNPPFSLAGPFVERSLELAHAVCMLLRVNYLASGRRNAWMREHVPDTYIIPNRPSFSGQGTDSPEYAWLLWTRVTKTIGNLRILNVTSLEERKRDKVQAMAVVGAAVLPSGLPPLKRVDA
jgi:hypothetical protein